MDYRQGTTRPAIDHPHAVWTPGTGCVSVGSPAGAGPPEPSDTMSRRSPFIHVPLPRPTPQLVHACAAKAGARIPRALLFTALPQSNFHSLPPVPTTGAPAYEHPTGSAKPTAVALGVCVGEGTGEAVAAGSVGETVTVDEDDALLAAGEPQATTTNVNRARPRFNFSIIPNLPSKSPTRASGARTRRQRERARFNAASTSFDSHQTSRDATATWRRSSRAAAPLREPSDEPDRDQHECERQA